MTDRREIQARLGAPQLARFFAAVRKRLEDEGVSAAKSVTLVDLDAGERTAIADLLGLKDVPENGKRLSLERLDAVLRSSAVEASLVEVLEVLFDAPLVDRRQQRATERAARETLWENATSRVAARPWLVAWLADLRASGIVPRFARAEGRDEASLLDSAIRVAMALPASGKVLAVFASEMTGDAHGLDHGRSLGATTLRAAARLAEWPALPATAAERRLLWQAVGVLVDPVSNDVLTLGLRPRGESRLARHLREQSDDGEPRRITLRELRAAPLTFDAGDLYVCENPSIVAAAADRLGRSCAPLVCVDGVPTGAALELLGRAQQCGARIKARADFDWPGVRIVSLLRERIAGVESWRYETRDYTSMASVAVEPLGPLDSGVKSRWDAQLVSSMEQIGRCVFEEQMLEGLLADLRAR